MSMNQLSEAYTVAVDRAHRSGLTIHIYWVTDEYSNGGYILISDLHLPQLSMQYDEFEYIDTVYPTTEIEEV